MHAGYPSLLYGEVPEEPAPRAKKKLCADTGGYSLHAALRTSAGQRRRLERLCRYIAKPALAQDRLLVSRDGRVIYRFRKAWRKAKQAVVMDPMTFLSRLAAQVPPSRFHMLSYYGVLAPAAPGRSEIVPGHGDALGSAGSGCVVSQQAEVAGIQRRKRLGVTRMVWAELIKRVFLEDVLACPCGGRRRVLSMVFDSESIVRVLRNLGLPCQRPIRASPRGVQGELGFPGC